MLSIIDLKAPMSLGLGVCQGAKLRYVLIGIILLCIIAVGVLGCSNKDDKNTAYDNLTMQANTFAKACRGNDYQQIVDLGYKPIIDISGGKDEVRDRLIGNHTDINIVDFQIESPQEPFFVNGHLVSIIESRVLYEYPDGIMKLTSFILGVSDNNGNRWSFVDGNGIRQSLEEYKIIFGNEMGDWEIPETDSVWIPA